MASEAELAKLRQDLNKVTGMLMMAFGAISKEPDPVVGVPPAEAATLIQMYEQIFARVAKSLDINALPVGWDLDQAEAGFSALSYNGMHIAYVGSDQKINLAPPKNPRIVSKENLNNVRVFIEAHAGIPGYVFAEPFAVAQVLQQSNAAALAQDLGANLPPVPDARLFGFILGDEGWLEPKEKNAFLTGQGAVRVEAIANKPANLMTKIEDEPDPSKKKPRADILSGFKFNRIQPSEPAELRVVQYANDLGDILTLAIGDLSVDQLANPTVQARINRAQDALRALATVSYERAPEALLDYARSAEVKVDRIPSLYENAQKLSPLAQAADQGYKTERTWAHSTQETGKILAIAVRELALEVGLGQAVIDRINQRGTQIAEAEFKSILQPLHEAWENTVGSRSAQHLLHGEDRLAWAGVGLSNLKAAAIFTGGKAASIVVGLFSDERSQQVEDRADKWGHRIQEQADIRAANLEQAARSKT